ncbi:MaoC family dehydratase [Mitsuokella sp. oral taxon 131]|uniref:MaoC family dehydratase n=1 Tax=Mitsuokella sp. oral taxon 131 TaxID=1321780 RepID=UPI0003AE3AA6|nr:MaoC family dehydratase [Mitsuokella sp. oral taxon 131]ERL04360.1 MaoC-like protein [Mitsuokella sp. oral taxon 131 str. W9106]
MKCYTYEELSVGQSAAFMRAITSEMMQQFRAVSGDNNPLHTCVEFAQTRGFRDRVVYGMLTASLYSCFAGEYIPGENCLLQSVHSDFLHPVFIGDVLCVEGKVAEKNDSVRQVVIKAVIRNQNGKKVSKARIEAGVL